MNSLELIFLRVCLSHGYVFHPHDDVHVLLHGGVLGHCHVGDVHFRYFLYDDWGHHWCWLLLSEVWSSWNSLLQLSPP